MSQVYLLMSSCRVKSISIGFTNQMRAAYYSTCKIVNAQKRSQQRDWHFQSERCASYVMGRLGFNLVRAKEKGGDCESTSAFAGENDEEEDILQTGKYVRHQEPGKKLYLLFLVSTTVVACFCVFVVIPQLVDYFTVPKVLNIENSICAPQKQSVIELLDTERTRRNQERLEIMHKVNALQRNYKLLQIEYRKAQEMFLKKLHNAYKYEKSVDYKLQNSHQTQSVASSSEQTEMEIFELDNTTANIHEDESERPPTEKISHSIVVL